MVSHKAGPLKQTKKAHKHGKHRSKGSLSVKGKAGILPGKGKCGVNNLNKKDRKNRDKQLKKVKLNCSAAEKRGLGGPGHSPICVVLLPAHSGVDLSQTLQLLRTQGEVHSLTDNSFYLFSTKLKKRLQVVCPGEGIFDQLDTVKCADLVVLVWDSSFIIDPLLRTCLFAQGLPPVQHMVMQLSEQRVSDKEFSVQKKQFTDILQKNNFSLNNAKVQYMREASDFDNALWGLVNFKQHTLGFLRERGYLISSSVELQDTGPETGTLVVRGYLRGQGLDPNQLLHIPGHGHFRVHKIVTSPDPFSETSSSGTVYESSNPASLEMECEINEMDAEQTWPTELDFAEAEEAKKLTKRVPKGTSAYQAVWMLSDDEQEEDSGMEEEEDEEEESEESEEELEDEESNDYKDSDNYDVTFDAEEEAEELRKFREACEDEQFPDEIDTPIDIAARVRFQKYRGLKSFRTSGWDPKENLPRDYARISQIRNFRNVRKSLLRQSNTDKLVPPGTHVDIYIADVPLAIRDSNSSSITVFSLLQHEQRLSVQHVAQARHPLSTGVVKCKEQLLAQVGFRRYMVQPIFSQHTKSNKHKMERFMPVVGNFVASFYAPITLTDSPAVLFKVEVDGSVTLLSTGTLLSCDPDRVVCKRVVLSGHPAKINKRAAVVRYLFHNREDIAYFRPVQIRTKHGSRGHIKEALGTHGHCKITFDKPIQQSDTVLLPLYKRVFPKWHFEYF